MPGVDLTGQVENIAIQSATAVSSLSVLREKFSSRRIFASYDAGSATPPSASSASASRKNCRARSIRPRVPISTAALTSSGRASMSSWAMKAPIDIPTMRAGAAFSPSISAAVSATMVSVVNPCAFSVAPMSRLSKVMTRYPAARKAGT